MDQGCVLVNADVHTMDPSRPRASAVAMADGRITGTGDGDELRSANPGARVVDLGGRVVIPGLVDAHCHFELTTTHLSYAVPLHAPPHSSLREICQTLRDRAASLPGSGWIVGRSNFGLHQFVAERRPITRQDLDEAVPDRPVVVYSGLHVTTLNTAGMRAAGLLDGEAPPMGALIDLDSGRGTELWSWLPQPEFGVDAVAAAMAGLGASMFTARGVTTINDIVHSADGVRAYQKLHREARLPARIDLRFHSPRQLTSADLAATGLETGFGDSWLRLGGIKLFVDGAGHDLAHKTLVDLKWHQEELDAEVEAAHRAGLQLMMHVQSAQAVDMALLALKRALAWHPRTDHRHRLEHAGDLPVDEQRLSRMSALGIVPVATPQFIYSYADAQPEASQPPLRSLHERGFRVPGNSGVGIPAGNLGAVLHSKEGLAGQALKIARNVRYGVTTRLVFPAQFSGLPSQWRVHSISYYEPVDGLLRADEYMLTTSSSRFNPHVGDTGVWADAPYIIVRPAPRKGTCSPHDPSSKNTSEVINGYRMVLKQFQIDGVPVQQLCGAHADGPWFDIQVFGAHPSIDVATLFRDHVRLLGTNPANCVA